MTANVVRPEIVRRQVTINFDDLPPAPWRTGAALELWLKAGSLIFPRGERFFIDAVRAWRESVTDPVLLEQIGDFIHQEAMHSKIHSDCNAALARDNSQCLRVVRWCDKAFVVFDRAPRGLKLTVSTAIEHFTAIASDTAFRNQDDFRQSTPAAFVDMWLWHAAEETEHKAVCFEVHRTVFGRGLYGYLHRIGGMLLATPMFLGGILAAGAFLYFGRRRTAVPQKPSNPDSQFQTRNMFVLMGRLVRWRLYFDYFRPSFEPWKHDNSHFVREWRARYPGFGEA